MVAVVSRSHVVELQSIRGLAALAVLIAHSLAVYGPPPAFLNAHAAIVIFFVLSGFVLTRSLRDRDLGSYLSRRMFRIYPMIWVGVTLGVIATAVASQPVEGMDASFLAIIPQEVTPRNLLGGFMGAGHSLNPPLWSISLEIVGSVLIMGIVLCASRPGLLLAIGAILLALSIAEVPLPFRAGVYLVDFWIGAMICLAEPQARRAVSRCGGWHLALFATILLFTRSFGGWDYHDPVPQLAEALAAALIIATLAYGPVQARLLRIAPLRKLGDISYSVYVLHFPLLMLFAVLIGASEIGMALPVWQRGLAICAATLAATLSLGVLTYRYVERPALALRRNAGKFEPLPLKPTSEPQPVT